MDSLSLLFANLLSPPVICFVTGVIAVWIRSDLKFPEQVYQALTIYLLLAIGFKGGSSMASSSLSELGIPLLATVAIGTFIPVVVFFATRYFLKMDASNAAALAAHYGSVSAVTFMAALAFLDAQKISYEAFMPAIMAAMEIPAIFVALLLAKTLGNRAKKTDLKKSLHEVISGKTLVLIICGLICGITSSEQTLTLITPFLIEPFYGILMLFLLEMGLIAGARLKDLKGAGKGIICFALIAPILQGALGLLIAWCIGLSQGGAVIFAVLASSASYIAAPAAVRVALPAANPGYYVTSSLGITFPFNLTLGIPLYLYMSGLFYS